MSFLDTKYANLLSPRLPLFKWRGDGSANFRCPLCGDSKKSKIKCRGYLYTHKGDLKFKCQNCGAGHSFDYFLKLVDYNLHREYSLESFKYNNDHKWFQNRLDKAEERVVQEIQTKQNNPLDHVECIALLEPGHIARDYVTERKIPKEYWSKLYYTPNYLKWVTEYVEKGKFKKVPKEDQRIVIPFFTGKGIPYAYQGRALYDGENVQRYITINPNKNNILIYGLEDIDSTKTVTVVEGPFDKMFLPNSVAVAGSALGKLFKLKQFDFVFCYDNQPRNKEVCDLMQKTIDADKKIVLWPSDLEWKDINDMIVKGKMSVEKILDIMSKNVYNGLSANLKFSQWRKI